MARLLYIVASPRGDRSYAIRTAESFVALARGGSYGEGSGAEIMDFQRPYLQMILSFMGITDQRFVVVEPTLAGGRETAMGQLEKAKAAAVTAAEES